MNNHRLYNRLIAPRSKDPNTRNQEAVLNWLLVGSLSLALVTFVESLISLIVLRETFLWQRLLAIFCLFLFFGVLLGLSRLRQQQTVPSVVLVSIFFGAAVWVVTHWGILLPGGILLFSLVIVMAGILLSARFSLYAALATGLALSVTEYAKAHHALHPDLSWQRQPSNFNDVAGYMAIYGILALVSWLFNGRMEVALTRAKRSERALKRQRDLLEVKVERRTRALQAAQLEQVQQVYRFAELGHLSTALFHDLANHVMSVNIDIEGLQKRKSSDILARIQNNVHHIDEVVRGVQRQIRGQGNRQRFDVMNEVQEVADVLAYSSNQVHVSIDVRPPADGRAITYRGDLTRFRQVIINLLSNAIEAYRPARQLTADRVVTVSAAKLSGNLMITVTDRGRGIRPNVQAKMFEPFYSTKDKGMGIGLFIVKKVIEEDFGGAISVSSSTRTGTAFVVTLPLRKDDTAARPT